MWIGTGGQAGPTGLHAYPARPTTQDVVTVVSYRAGNVHWGVNDWTEPPQSLWPQGTTAFGDKPPTITFLLDGTKIGDVQVRPYDLVWDSTTVSADAHSLTARASDDSGHQADDSITITTGSTDHK